MNTWGLHGFTMVYNVVYTCFYSCLLKDIASRALRARFCPCAERRQCRRQRLPPRAQLGAPGQRQALRELPAPVGGRAFEAQHLVAVAVRATGHGAQELQRQAVQLSVDLRQAVGGERPAVRRVGALHGLQQGLVDLQGPAGGARPLGAQGRGHGPPFQGAAARHGDLEPLFKGRAK